MRTEDGFIIHKCLNGDSGAFGLLVDKYKAGVYALAYSKLRNFHDAQDVAQEVFIKVYENLHSLRRWESFAGWLYRITARECTNLMRSRSKRPDYEFIEDRDPGILNENSMDSYRQESALKAVHEALDSLPEVHRQVLTLHYLGGMTSFEIAKFSGVSPSAVRRRLMKARGLIKAEIIGAMGTAFEEQKLSASFTLRIMELVKHIRVKPLPRLAELPWGVSVGTIILTIILSLGIFGGIQDIMNSQMESAALGQTGSAGTGEILVDIVEQTPDEKEGDTSMLNNRKITVFSAITALLALLSGNAIGQTEWEQYPKPVLDVGPEAWDSQNIWDSPVLIDPTCPIGDPERYKMWYVGHPGGVGDTRIGLATSSDGITWEKQGKLRTLKNGVEVEDGLLGIPGEWDDNTVFTACILFHEGIYKMWYAGKDDIHYHYRIGYATSTDGRIWTKYNDPKVLDDPPFAESTPVLNVGPGGTWDEMDINEPTVIIDPALPIGHPEKYKMWYSGSYDTGSGVYYAIGYATSSDGVVWEKHNDPTTSGLFAESDPVLVGEAGAWDYKGILLPCALFHCGEYRMWYSGYGDQGFRIGYATSPDGIVWTKYDGNNDGHPDVVMDIGAWHNQTVYRPRVQIDGNVYRMWYCGNSHNEPKKIGYATSIIPNQPPTADAGGPYSGSEGSPILLDASNSSDPDGDSLQFRWDFDNDGTWDTAWSSAPTTAHTWDDDWSGLVVVEVSDGALTDTDTASVTVNNVAPTVGAITAPVDPVEVNTQINATADFTDPGVLDTHTAIWDWGDNSTLPGNISNGTVSGSHEYAEAGVYTVKVTVTDDDGGAGESPLFQYVVIYDPDGGFVTGGGWIDSPEGAYTANPDLTGKANFGFVSKYKKGADIPTGNTQFVFRVADLNFHSTVYQWLVVAGAQAKFKGDGIINGSGDYGFMLTAVDGQVNGGGDVDKFRIKIWDKSTDAVVYDNQMGADDDGADATELGGGSIVIHSDKKAPEQSAMLPKNTLLLAAYPQPCNPDVWIPYQLNAVSEVSISIHDSIGRLVCTLDIGTKLAGTYIDKTQAAHWDGTNESGEPVASGMYFYTIQAGEFADTRKLLILR